MGVHGLTHEWIGWVVITTNLHRAYSLECPMLSMLQDNRHLVSAVGKLEGEASKVVQGVLDEEVQWPLLEGM